MSADAPNDNEALLPPTVFSDDFCDDLLDHVDEMAALMELVSRPTIGDDECGPEMILMVTLLHNNLEDEFLEHISAMNPVDLRTMLRVSAGTLTGIFEHAAAERGVTLESLLQELALDFQADAAG